jgi:O-antigen/teichoic acid export membrane protein
LSGSAASETAGNPARPPEPEPAGRRGIGSYGSGARILTIGIASTGIFSFLYLALASRSLSSDAYGRVSLMWSVMFVILSVIYRPIEQLLSRTIADRRARGLQGHTLRVPALIQFGFAALFLAAALLLRPQIEDNLFDGSAGLYWILVVGVLAYAASYFARGWLAGHQRFELYGGLVFLESTSRFLFALAVAVGIAEGQTAVALGIAAAPFVSLVVVPLAWRRRDPDPEPGAVAEREGGLTFGHGARFAVSVLAIMLAEQTLLNAAVLTTDATSSDAALAGFVFNVLLIARAPLQLFQAIQTSLLPHLSTLHATDEGGDFDRAIRITVIAIAGFAGAVALGLLAIGPFAMDVLFGGDFTYGRWGLALVAVGMGLHLASGTLNQAALARRHAGAAAACWIVAAVAFVGWLVAPVIDDQLVRAEVGYFGATLLLSVLLAGLYRRSSQVLLAQTSTF